MSPQSSPTSGRPGGALVWAIRCPCGLEVAADGEVLLVAEVNDHLDQQHPQLAGRYADEDVLSLAYRRPS